MMLVLLRLFAFFLFVCATAPANGRITLTFKDKWVYQRAPGFEDPPVGGLSGLFYDESSGDFFALSDDKSQHRFYRLVLQKTGSEYHFEFKERVFLRSPGHEHLLMNMDPEALLFYQDHWIIASEGQQIYDPPEPTQIFSFENNGVLHSAWPVPPVFWREGQSGPSGRIGPQSNKGFESLTLERARGLIWAATEEPLRQDMVSLSRRFVRLSAFDISQKQMKEQYLYPLENKGGLTALQFIDSQSFVVLERSLLSFIRRIFLTTRIFWSERNFLSMERVYYKTHAMLEDKKKAGLHQARIFWTHCQGADNIAEHTALRDVSLIRNLKTCQKSLLWDSKAFPHLRPDNLEGMALGPYLGENRRLLVLVSDNNFQSHQKTQFLFFELSGG